MKGFIKNICAVSMFVLSLGGCGSDPQSGEHDIQVEFVPTPQQRMTIIYYNLDRGMASDAASGYAGFVSWLSAQDCDMLVACEADAAMLGARMSEWGHTSIVTADADDGYPVVVTSKVAPSFSETVEVESGKPALHVQIGDIHVVGMDIDRSLEPLDAYDRMVGILDATYDNRSYVASSWIVGGSMYHLSIMDMDYGIEWYPDDLDADEYRFDLYAWNDNLIDCVAQLYKYNIPTFTPPEDPSKAYRADYVYVSRSVYEGNIDSVEIMDDEFTAAASAHKPIRISVRY